MKIIKSVYLDLEVINAIEKELKINVSQTVNSYLRYFFGIDKKNKLIKEKDLKKQINKEVKEAFK